MIRFIMLPFVGFLVGLLVISLGGGGGLFYVGILTALFNIPPEIAASTSLATIIPTTATGAFSHYRAGNVNIRYGVMMLAAGAAGAIGGSLYSRVLPRRAYSILIAVIMLFLSVQMIVSYIMKIRRGAGGEIKKPGERMNATTIARVIFFGVLGGAMSGLIGLSGGGPIVAGLSIMGCGALETVGTSVLVLLGISITGFAMHLGLNNVHWNLVGLLLSGTVLGAFTGPVLLAKIDRAKMEKFLQPVLLVMVLVMGISLLFK
jgi:uncharacterized protein